MKITSFDTGLYSVPLTESWGSSNYSFTSLEFVVVWLHTDTGHTGTGWTFSVGNGGSAFKNLVDHYLAPKVVGRDPLQVERLWNAMWLESHDIGSGGASTHAIAAVDIAVWDLVGQELGQPLYRLLGDYRDSLPGYGSGVNLHLSLDDLLAQIESFLAQGYRSIKMKIGRDPHEDLDRVMAVRKLVGPSVGDPRRRQPEVVPTRGHPPDPAAGAGRPVLAGGADAARTTWRATSASGSASSVPIAVGESLYTKHQFADWITRGACDYVQPNVHRVGGVTEFMKIVKLAEGHNVPVSPHFGMELVAHLGCAAPNIIGFEGLRGAGLSEMGIVEEPTVVTDGRIRPSQRPGHGVRFRRDVLEQHALTEADLRAERPVTRIDLH